VMGRADDLVIYRGAKFYPVQVEKVLRGMPELSDEFRIVLTTDEKRGSDVCTVVVELLDETVDKEALTHRLRGALREELQVTPAVDFVRVGTLERTTFKAKRLEDRRET